MIKKFLDSLDNIILATVAIIGLLLSVFDLFGWFNLDNTRISVLILFLLSMISLYMTRERRNSLEEIQKDIALLKEQPAEIISALDGVRVRTFKNAFELLEYTTQRVIELTQDSQKHWIDDTSWGIELGYEAQLPKNQEISLKHREIMRAFGESNTYRDIFIFTSPSKFEKINQRLELSGYSCAYYREKPDVLPINFLIIDDKEVILLADNFDGNMAVQHPEIVRMFKIYYEKLWDKAITIKDSHGIREEVLAKVNKDFKSTSK